MSLNFPTSYYFRGIAQSNAGFLFQPYLELKANIYEGAEKDVVTGGKGFELWGGVGNQDGILRGRLVRRIPAARGAALHLSQGARIPSRTCVELCYLF